jgi:tetratricopeptide (TPR) repeat protein
MKKILLSTLLTSILLANTNTSVSTKTENAISIVNQNAVKVAKDSAKNSQVTLVKEAIKSLQMTTKALEALEKKDAKLAQERLEKALGKLELLLSSKKAPMLLPIDNVMAVYEYVGDKKDIQLALKSVKKLLEDGKVQVARELLSTLRSEIDVTVVNLPLATYPDALKLAGKYIHDGKLDRAKSVLEVALSTFEKEINVIPIPLLKASDLIAVSATLAKEGKKEEALQYLKSADDELNIAETLGYVSHSDSSYAALHKEIDAVRKEINGENKSAKFFDTLKDMLKDFKDKVFSQK